MIPSAIKPPNLFLIGAPKCGTSALADGLAQHPSIFLDIKEPRFFDAHVFYDRERDYPIRSVDQYLDLYRSAAAQSATYRLDASVFCMYSPAAIKGILEVSPDARFLLILRDPLSAAKSMHGQRMKHIDPALREISEDFCECWKQVEFRRVGRSLPEKCRNSVLFRYDFLYHYEWHVPNITRIVDPRRFLLLQYERFAEEPLGVFRAIFEFLEIKEAFEPQLIRVNPSYMVNRTLRNRIIDTAIKKTSAVRSLLGLRGRRVRSLKHLAEAARQKRELSRDVSCEEEVRREFEETYRYMEFATGDFPRAACSGDGAAQSLSRE